jgi:hypothetical protein
MVIVVCDTEQGLAFVHTSMAVEAVVHGWESVFAVQKLQAQVVLAWMVAREVLVQSPPLHLHHPFHVARTIVADWIWARTVDCRNGSRGVVVAGISVVFGVDADYHSDIDLHQHRAYQTYLVACSH